MEDVERGEDLRGLVGLEVADEMPAEPPAEPRGAGRPLDRAALPEVADAEPGEGLDVGVRGVLRDGDEGDAGGIATGATARRFDAIVYAGEVVANQWGRH